MSPFSPITDADLARAHTDPIFRQRLLERSMEALLGGMKRLRGAPAAGENAKKLREGVELAVKLAELIQSAEARAASP
ncbi:MAG: hypothetical protein WBD71_09680 [Xanthobacteraceae bacterium]